MTQVVLASPEGDLDAKGLTFESSLDMRYTHSSVCQFFNLGHWVYYSDDGVLVTGADGVCKDVGRPGLR